MAISQLRPPALLPNQKRITILGAGIVGSALAYHVSTRMPSSQVILLDPSPSSTAGSTGIAPGLIGQLNIIPQLTIMAEETAAAYSRIPGGFQRVGGLELASTKEGISELERRKELAVDHGLKAEILNSERITEFAPDFCAVDNEMVGVYFPGDGTADPEVIMRHYQDQARAQGVAVVTAKVSTVSTNANERIHLTTDKDDFESDEVIVATGIWTAALLKSLEIDVPIIPVGHPYAYGPLRARREKQQPFVRWPERHVYARDHGEYDGFGTYAHDPVCCLPGENARMIDGIDLLSGVLESATSVFPASLQHSLNPYKAFNGIFAVTPDSMPFAGAVPHIPGLYVAAAIWITHAAGVARLVADMIAGYDLCHEDELLRIAFNPMRLKDDDPKVLKNTALGTYNNIYNQDKH